jgi:uncharacterized protein
MEIPIFDSIARDTVVELTGDAAELDILSDEYALAGPVSVTCRLQRDGEIIRIGGTVRARLDVQCARCAEPFELETEGSFSLVVKRLLLGEPVPGEASDEEEADSEQLVYVEHYVKSIDITPHVRDALILSLPMKIVCAEDCKGLCPSCGQNLNEGGCDCKGTAVDPRWGTLGGVFDGKEKK